MDYIYEFFLFIVATLTGNWLWQLWLDKRESKKQKAKTLNECLEKIQACIHELEYNATPGIGGSRSPFKLTAQEQLLYSRAVSLLGEELTNSLKQLITEAGIANGEYSMKGPAGAKSTSKLLKEFLQKRSEELKASSDMMPIRRFSLQRLIKFRRPK
ncbi:MAG: hypothetical protein JSR93_00110 [Verrucomicrobia bacterium]|nr:hypothetical protein [Verrucomicrobiota bacterium]